MNSSSSKPMKKSAISLKAKHKKIRSFRHLNRRIKNSEEMRGGCALNESTCAMASSFSKQGGTTRILDYPILKVIDAIKATLGQNGYTILARMQTDLKAVYLTDRKTSHPSSLELTGFRNQYLLSIEKKSSTQSSIWVQADFEKISQNTKILETGKSEITEIEQRLIEEIQQSLKIPKPSATIPLTNE